MESSHPINQRLLGSRQETIRNDIKTSHVCVETYDKHAWVQFVSQWYLILLYLPFIIIFTFSMVFWLNGKSFEVEGSSNSPGGITQSDVTTIISAALVIARTIGAAWQALVAWRCVFILLERNGLSLAETSRLISWRLPTLPMFGASPLHTGHAGMRAIAILVLLLVWPAQFSNPIASGSVSWIPSRAYWSFNTSFSLGTPNASIVWTQDSNIQHRSEAIVKMATGRAILAATDLGKLYGRSLVPPAQRIITNFGPYPNATAVKNATVPIFKIENLQWVANLTMLPGGILRAVQDYGSGYLNFSRDIGPLGQMIPGTAALLKDTAWNLPVDRVVPRAEVFSGTKFAAIYVSRQNNYGQGSNFDCHSAPSYFDPLPEGIQLISIPWANNYSDCIAVAKLRITAGVTRCYQEGPSPSSNSTCLLFSSGVLFASNNTVSPGVFVQETFAIMPEVQSLVAALHLFNPKALKGTLEVYLRNSLTQAYQGTWSALIYAFVDLQHQLPTATWQPYLVLEARVLAWRVYLWLGINMLLVASGPLLFAMQSRCRVRTINDPVVASLMMDSSEIIGKDKTGLCNATDIGAGHGNADIRVFIKVNPCGSLTEDYSHHKLVPQYTDEA